MCSTVDRIEDTQPPTPRIELRVEVIRTGYKTYKEFANRVGIHRSSLSLILGGLCHPSPRVQRALAKELGLTLLQLRQLL